MKKILIIILPLLIAVSSVFLGFGILQAKNQKDRLIDEVKRKARAVAESTEWAACHALKNKDLSSAFKIVDKFQKRERPQGCVLYDKEGKIIAVTEHFSRWQESSRAPTKPPVTEAPVIVPSQLQL